MRAKRLIEILAVDTHHLKVMGRKPPLRFRFCSVQKEEIHTTETSE
jgi:hypothetical protein